MKRFFKILGCGLGLVFITPFLVCAQTYINENFESDTLGSAPTDALQKNAVQVTVATGTGNIGTSQVANFNDILTTGGGSGGDLEYSTSAAVGNLYIRFDLLNNNPTATGSAANPCIIGVGAWDTGAGTKLGAAANRAFGVEFYQDGASSTLRLRVNSTAVVTSTYTMTALQQVAIWVNDSDSATLTYARPDNGSAATLGIDSFVVWVNNSLVGTEADTGIAMFSTITTGNTTLGRFGFNSSSGTVTNFLMDNLFVGDVSAAIPEPSTYGMILIGALLFGWWGSHTRRVF